MAVAAGHRLTRRAVAAAQDGGAPPPSLRVRRCELAYPGMRIGLFGGTFNPAHEGHAHVAEQARKRLGLHKVWWLVTPQNPLKPRRGARPLAARMLSAASLARGPDMVVSDLEWRWGLSYTAETIHRLRQRLPGVRFVWIMGADNLIGFHHWRRWRRILAEAPCLVVARPGAGARARLSKTAQAAGMAPAQAVWRRRPPVLAYLSAPLEQSSSTSLRAGGRSA